MADSSPPALRPAADGKEPFTSQLAALRERIDAIDRDILAALNARARWVQAVGELKRRCGEPVYAAAREQNLIAALRRSNRGPFPAEGIAPVFREIISATRSLERRMRVAYLGPEGSFGHEAARLRFGSCTDLLPVDSHEAIFEAVAQGRADHGVIPVENSSHGIITDAFDALAAARVVVGGELFLPVRHHLMSRSGRMAEIRRLLTHPQALAQCRRWVDRYLPGVPRLQSASTAAAAQQAATEPDLAAIGSAAAAEVYGLAFAARSIEDRADNTTRFLMLGGDPPEPSGDDLTLVICTVRKAQAGSLYRLLAPFAERGINLTSIQSRPIPERPWEYRFYLDIAGHGWEPQVAAALDSARELAHDCRVLGSFPRGTRGAEREGSGGAGAGAD